MDLFRFFKNKKSYMCPLMNNNLHFTSRDTLEPCCSANVGPVFVSNLSQNDSIKNFIEVKKRYIKMLKDGTIPKECTNCVHVAEYKDTDDFRINKITLNHYTQCNCACVYCTQGNRSFEKIKEDENKPVLYNVLEFIQELYANNMIDRKNLYIDFQGGNISCLKNHESIINMFLEKGVGTIYIPTNNITYMPVIEKLLKMGKGEFSTALDSGTNETFKRIKQVDKFNSSVDNLKRYISEAGPSSIIVKYIITSGYNDNLAEFQKFMDIMTELTVKTVVLDIDYRNIIDTAYTIPEHYYEIVSMAKDLCKKNNINLGIPPYTQSVLDRGYSIK